MGKVPPIIVFALPSEIPIIINHKKNILFLYARMSVQFTMKEKYEQEKEVASFLLT